MDNDRLKQLKEKNKLFVRRKKWEENQLLQDCIKVLHSLELVENEEQIQKIISSMQERFSFGAYHQLNIDEMNLIPAMNYYIVWDNAELPIIKCKWKYILESFDDVVAVSFDTYIVAEDFSECFHNDDRGKLWKCDEVTV